MSGELTSISEVGMCYFAALCDGLRLINEQAAERPDLVEDFNADALIHYVRAKGDSLVNLLYPGELYHQALRTMVSIAPRAVVRKRKERRPPLLPALVANAPPGRHVPPAVATDPVVPAPVVRQDAEAAKTFKCRWCDFERPARTACPRCGKLSNTWSAKRAAVPRPCVREHPRQDANTNPRHIVERLIWISDTLKSGHSFNAATHSKRWSVTAKTAHRDIVFLCDRLGFKIAWDGRANTYRLIEAPPARL